MNITNDKEFSLRSFLSAFFSFELLFILFLFSGRYKAAPSFAWIPIDLTAIFFTLSLFAGVLIYFTKKTATINKYSLYLLLLWLLLTSYAFLSMAWSPSINYATEKTMYMATLVLWALLGSTVIISNDIIRVYRFMLLVFLFAFLLGIEFIFWHLKNDSYLIARPDYLAIGRVIGLGCIIAFFYSVVLLKSLIPKTLCFSVFFVLLYVMLALGGKGPFIAVILSLIVFSLLYWHTHLRISSGKKKYAIILIITLSIGFIYILSMKNDFLTFYRLESMTTKDESTSIRLDYYQQAISLWLTHPVLGNGIGSFPVLIGHGDVQNYPHNIILELLSELGIVGCAIFLLMLLLSIKSLKNQFLTKEPIKLLILMLCFYVLLNALVSADIPDRTLFAILGLSTLSVSPAYKNLK